MCRTPYHGRRRKSSVLFDCDILDRHLARKNWTQSDLANKADVSIRTIANIMAGRRIQAATAARIATAFEVTVIQLTPVAQGKRPSEVLEGSAGGEWKCAEAISPWITAPNGLQYRICRMTHAHIRGRKGRGRFYDLRYVPNRLRSAMDECLVRHASVCNDVSPHPNIVENISCVPSDLGQGWWVVDEWSEATLLSELIANDVVALEDSGWILIGILDGLLRLHECKVIFRELAPSHVLVNVARRQVQLTDFELAKLLKDVPSVSAGWQTETAYRAPEVSRNDCSKQADYFSFGRLVLHLLTGQLPPTGQDQNLLGTAGLPKGLQSQLSRCLELLPSKRLRHLRTLRKQLINWSASCQ